MKVFRDEINIPSIKNVFSIYPHIPIDITIEKKISGKTNVNYIGIILLMRYYKNARRKYVIIELTA